MFKQILPNMSNHLVQGNHQIYSSLSSGRLRCVISFPKRLFLPIKTRLDLAETETVFKLNFPKGSFGALPLKIIASDAATES